MCTCIHACMHACAPTHMLHAYIHGYMRVLNWRLELELSRLIRGQKNETRVL